MYRKESSEERQAVIKEATSWLGTNFHHQGRVKGAGVDCVGILLEVYSEVGVISEYSPDYYPQDWMLHRDDERYLREMLKFAHEIDGPPKPADVAMFKFARTFSHAAIVVEWPVCIHSYFSRGVELVDVTKDAQFFKREVKFFSAWE